MPVYVLVAILKKRLHLDALLHTPLQILSVTVFEKMPLVQALLGVEPGDEQHMLDKQLNLFMLTAR